MWEEEEEKKRQHLKIVYVLSNENGKGKKRKWRKNTWGKIVLDKLTLQKNISSINFKRVEYFRLITAYAQLIAVYRTMNQIRYKSKHFLTNLSRK